MWQDESSNPKLKIHKKLSLPADVSICLTFFFILKKLKKVQILKAKGDFRFPYFWEYQFLSMEIILYN